MLLLLLKEAIGTVESEADALNALRDVSIDADQLKQKMDAAGCGIPDGMRQNRRTLGSPQPIREHQ